MADRSLAQNVGLDLKMENFGFSLRYLVGIVVVIGSLVVFQSCQLNAAWIGISKTHLSERGPNMCWVALADRVVGIDIDAGVQTDSYGFDLGTGGSLICEIAPVDDSGNLYVPIYAYDSFTSGDSVIQLDADGNRKNVISVLSPAGFSRIYDSYLVTDCMAQYDGFFPRSVTRLSDLSTEYKKIFTPPSGRPTKCDGKYWYGCGGTDGDVPYFWIWDPAANSWTKETDRRTSMGIDYCSHFGTAAGCQLAAEFYNHILYRINCSSGSVIKSVNLDEAWGTVTGDTLKDGDVSISPLYE